MQEDDLRTIWWKDGKAIAIDDRISLNSQNNSLTIRSVTRKDVGRYTCMVTDGLDSVNASAFLSVKEMIRMERYPSDLEVSKGAEAIFICAATSDTMQEDDLQTIWWKDGKAIAIDGDRISQNSQNNSLTIRSVTRKDVGRYTCMVTDGLDSVNASAFLSVKVTQPPVILINPPTQVLFKEFQTAVLPCKASGEPQPTYTWKKGKQDFNVAGSDDFISTVPNEGTLVFKRPRKKDAGMYQCFANNSYGVAMSGIVELRLAFLQPYTNQEPETITVSPGSSLVLPCNKPISYPEANVTWVLKHKDGSFKAFDFTERILMDHQANLIFTNILEEDSYRDAAYVCVATNKFSRETTRGKPFHLKTIPTKPEWTTKPKSIVTSVGSSVTFICNGTSKPPISKHMWYINGKRINEYPNKNKFIVQETNLTVINLTHQDSMTIQCNMSNIHGYIFADAFLHVFAEAPDLLEKGNMTLKRSEGQTINITCKTSGYDSVQVLWTKDDKQMTGDRYHILRNGNLNIKNLDLTDAGVYHCYASNKYGMVSAMRTLIVRRKTKIEPSAFDRRVKEGRAVTLPCAATTDPMEVDNLQVIWLKEGKSIDMDEGRIIQNTQDNSLTINSVIIGKDGGRYTCVATNGLDWAKMSTFLYVMGP
ncbi:hemicentin-1-like isoform X3 [Octopus vulgaris]|nr:hemicentin-1-like isoform X3 [Octopus vulgaris]